ncbi:quinone oxidoreductase [Cladophialophora chaetospira]|uniref:Quinone oxidoreductase n=1 Tax=Cladophialophora chaetospira TaxID=386627 RepID=A0AA38X210_9EURO|nr:quinone oxidoreductase [Cladophialophora chaetospira]
MASSPSSTRSWVVENHPKGVATFDANDASSTFKLVDRPIPALEQDQVLVKSIYYSNDPAQRPAIDASVKAERHYTAPVKLGDPMMARGIGEVIESKADKLPKGTIVQGNLGWNEYVVLNAAEADARQPLPNGLSMTHYLGAFGGTGLTAYYGLVVVGEAKKGQRIVISGAAGATGSMTVQIAKNIVGASEVIGIAGTDEKCKWVETLGADKCLNYKSPTFEQDLIKATDGFVDIYFDNVGGSILDLMLTRVKQHGVIVQCGLVSDYNSMNPTVLKSKKSPPSCLLSRYGRHPQRHQVTDYSKDYFQVITMRLSIRGFIVIDFLDKAAETIKLFIQALKDGKLKISDEESEQVVDTKFEDVPKTWLKLFDGGNTGKLVTKIV